MVFGTHNRHNCWHIYYGDVHVGTIAERTSARHRSVGMELRLLSGLASEGTSVGHRRDLRRRPRRFRARMA